MTATGVQVVEDEREIYRAIVGFARAMDERDWGAIEDLISPDFTGELGSGPLASGAEMIDLLRGFLDDCGPTQHMVGTVLIDVGVDGNNDVATSRAYVSDMHLGVGEKVGLFFRTLGDYHDTWGRTGDGWKLVQRIKRMNGTVGDIAVLQHGMG